MEAALTWLLWAVAAYMTMIVAIVAIGLLLVIMSFLFQLWLDYLRWREKRGK